MDMQAKGSAFPIHAKKGQKRRKRLLFCDFNKNPKLLLAQVKIGQMKCSSLSTELM